MDYIYNRIINYYETDKMGVVHHSNYIRFLEEARCRWLEAYKLPMEEIEELGYTIPTLEVDCKYKNHVSSGDTITIKPMIAEYNGVRMTISYEVIDKKTGKTVIDAKTKHCFTDRSLKPVNMKKKNKKIDETFQKLYDQYKEIQGK